MDRESRTRSLAAVRLVRRMLLELARDEDDLAATQAAESPYWLSCPPSVHGHRAAAVALRAQADRLTVGVGSLT